MKGGARKRLLGWFLPSAAAKKIALRLIESIKEKRYFLPIEHWLSEKQVTSLAEAAVAFVRAGS